MHDRLNSAIMLRTVTATLTTTDGSWSRPIGSNDFDVATSEATLFDQLQSNEPSTCSTLSAIDYLKSAITITLRLEAAVSFMQNL